MIIKRLVTLLTVLAVVGLCFSAALAQEAHPPHAVLLKSATSSVDPAAPAAPTGVWIPWADFAAFSNATNSDSSFLWPCFGEYAPSSGTNTGHAANPDCPTIGDPSVPFPNGGVVLGNPSYLWTLAACNATSTSSPNCADQESFVTDNSADLTDELLVSIVITQGSGATLKTIYNSGTVDYGSNIFGVTASQFPINWINYNPQNLGDMGVATGPNNGNCFADLNYPIPGANYAAITSISETGTTVTVKATNSFAAGQLVEIGGTSNANYNDQGIVSIATATSSSFTYTAAKSGLGSATGGHAILYATLVEAAGKTCSPAASGTANGTFTVEYAKPTYTEQTSSTKCSPIAAPCYTVTYTKKSMASYKFTIDLH